MTQIELAKFLGISNERLCRYESGAVLVPAWVLMVVTSEAAKLTQGNHHNIVKK